MFSQRQIVQQVLHAVARLRAYLGNGVGELVLGGKTGLAKLIQFTQQNLEIALAFWHAN